MTDADRLCLAVAFALLAVVLFGATAEHLRQRAELAIAEERP